MENALSMAIFFGFAIYVAKNKSTMSYCIKIYKADILYIKWNAHANSPLPTAVVVVAYGF